jgi:hypothetical protein
MPPLPPVCVVSASSPLLQPRLAATANNAAKMGWIEDVRIAVAHSVAYGGGAP